MIAKIMYCMKRKKEIKKEEREREREVAKNEE
jgi:hypothetical protein